ncbi:thiol-disulfide oxidoreductase DCC family protein [Biformimicrobium ophioploci]|uniref:DUF393 domain-containing protein n=1 Tax=Biformimicrobium ophioploci TaxID=3036711 RepID=A0ABQ6LUL5_9GAMM|nr:DUF393 domain-containing protein [Microbulbifer sp. NKW57]GMG85756.1 DUF393 domain-containing protein [Microbulbifer sp. NKW57]
MTHKLLVYYDGACPTCVRDMAAYRRLAGRAAENVEWFDITGQDDALRERGIDPVAALRSLHVRDRNGQLLEGMPAYAALLREIWWCRPLAAAMLFPPLRAPLEKVYRRQVDRRLCRSGRMP